MSEKVTYVGPADEFVVPAGAVDNDEDVLLLRDEQQKVSNKVWSFLQKQEGEEFTTGEPAPSAPWVTYEEESASDIVERLGSVDVDTARIVLAYERDHAGRKTVLEAAESAAEPHVEQGP